MNSEIDTQRQEDLDRYINTLPQCEDYEDRLFFINGIISLIDLLEPDYPWKQEFGRSMHYAEQEGYSTAQIEKASCVPRGGLGTGYKKRIVVGITCGLAV